MAQALTSQMNIRISTSLKRRGDTALAHMGYSASEVVRAIWSLAASGSSGMDELRGVLAKGTILSREESQDQATDGKPTATYDATPLQPWELFDYYVAQLGEGYEVVPSTFSDDELLEMETFDRMEEKGLI